MQMVFVGSRVLSEEHSQIKEPGLFLQTPLMQGLDSHSSMSETKTGAHYCYNLVLGMKEYLSPGLNCYHIFFIRE